VTVLLLSLVAIGALALAALCAGAETGLLSIRRGRLLHLVRAGSRRAKILQVGCQNVGRATIALLVGNNLAAVTYSSASSALSSVLFADSSASQAVWGGCAAFAILYFGEFAPKLFCAARPLRIMLVLAPVLSVFAKVFEPIGAFVLRIVGRFIPKRESRMRVTPDAVQKILADRKDGVKLSDLESALIGRILALRAKGEAVTPDVLLPVLDDCMV